MGKYSFSELIIIGTTGLSSFSDSNECSCLSWNIKNCFSRDANISSKGDKIIPI